MSDHFGTLCIKGLKNNAKSRCCKFLFKQVVLGQNSLLVFDNLKIRSMDHSFKTHAKFSEKLLFLTYTRTCAYQGVRNASFLENFLYVLNKWMIPYPNNTSLFYTRKMSPDSDAYSGLP